MKESSPVDIYISAFPSDVQAILSRIRKNVKDAIPNAEECMVYGVPGYKLNDAYLVGYAAFREHAGIYPTPAAIKAFRKDLLPYKTSKGAIQFPLGKPVPFGLVKKIVKFRAGEILKGSK